LAFRSSDPLMDQQGRPNEPQLVYRRDPETGKPVEGFLRWGLIPHFCERRPDFAPIHARAETVAENEWFSDAYLRRRCVVPMNSFFQKNSSGKRYAISRRDGEPFGVAGIWENWRNPPDGHVGTYVRRHYRPGQRIGGSDPRPHAGNIAGRAISAMA